VQAWAERYPAQQASKRRGWLRGPHGRGFWLLASAIVFGALLAPAFAIAQGGGSQTFSSSARYTVISRNTNTGSGGATAQTCNTTPGNQACENNVNFGTGYAATYRTTGPTAVYFQTSGPGTATPFLLSPNATGEVQYLNANMVGGLTASQLFANYSQQSSTSSSVTKGQGETASASVTCPTGTNIISQSGAVNQSSNASGGQAVLQSVAPTSSTQATATAVVTGPNGGSGATFTVTAYAVCANI
jgi:hypothetical protein